jgi:hypothetical protein
MSRTVVGRIFWKELRAQRGMWLGVTGLMIGIQALLTVFALSYRHPPRDLEELYDSVFPLAYLGAVFYAIGSGAASFTEETEGNTAVLLRTVPMTPSEAFAGKWGFGLASTGVLFAVLAVAAGLCSCSAWLAIAIQGTSAFSHSPVPSAADINVPLSSVWIGILTPVAFFAFCALFSLLLSNGLMAALCGSVCTVVALALVEFLDGRAGVPALIAQQLTVIAGALVVIDFWLTGIWLRQGTFFGLRWTGRWPVEWTAGWEWRVVRIPRPIELLRFGEPAVSWKRAAQRLAWKELRQAGPYVAISLFAATVLLIPPVLDPLRRLLGNLSPWTFGMAIPLLMGVGAYRSDQKGRAYRFLGDLAVTPDGSWIVKHLIWMGLTFLTCGYALFVERIGWQLSRERAFALQDSILYGIGRSFARPGFRLRDDQPPLMTGLDVVGLYIVLAYSIGQRLSFAIAKGLLAFGLAMGATILACQAWAIFSHRGVPLWWTIGAIPAALMAYTWVHTQRWQAEQLYSYRWTLIAAWMALPLAGIAVAVCVYWPFPIS